MYQKFERKVGHYLDFPAF